MSAKGALTLLAHANLSYRQYQTVKRTVKKGLPNYNEVLEEKKECLPQGVKYNDCTAELPLAELVRNTLGRLTDLHHIGAPPTGYEYSFHWKWGKDGAGAPQVYVQSGIFRGR